MAQPTSGDADVIETALWMPTPRLEGSCSELFVYLDEQLPNPDQGQHTFGVGVLMTSAPVSTNVVTSTMAQLPRTAGALKRGYFHASRDRGVRSKTLLAESIRVHVPSGEFTAARWDDRKGYVDGPSSIKEKHMHVLSLALQHAYALAGECVHVEYAAAATLDKGDLHAWLSKHQDARLQVMRAQHGALPTRFPRVELVELQSRNSAGLQVVDLLLWSQRRELEGTQADRGNGILERAGLLKDSKAVARAGPNGFYRYVLQKGLPIRQSRPPGHGLDDLDWQNVLDRLFAIERVVHQVADARPSAVGDQMGRVKAVSSRFRGVTSVSNDDLLELLELFAIVADTLPVYEHSRGAEHVQYAADAIRIALELLDLRETRTITVHDAWQQARARNPACLGW